MKIYAFQSNDTWVIHHDWQHFVQPFSFPAEQGSCIEFNYLQHAEDDLSTSYLRKDTPFYMRQLQQIAFSQVYYDASGELPQLNATQQKFKSCDLLRL